MADCRNDDDRPPAIGRDGQALILCDDSRYRYRFETQGVDESEAVLFPLRDECFDGRNINELSYGDVLRVRTRLGVNAGEEKMFFLLGVVVILIRQQRVIFRGELLDENPSLK